ncbi:MAG TPA: TadE/TadG family type IV pilus assembly protein [Chloroflexota bacterium]|jgi:Flp pilus assembly protein TadG|nr:TadE/TadG family type IV pilus assembly protein [Chloroflexota bacterium]
MIRHRQEGTTILTFALIAPLVLIIIFGVSEMGRVMQAWMVVTNEAREAARYAAVNFDSTKDWTSATNQSAEQTAVRAYITNRLTGVLDQTYLSPPPAVVVTTDSPPKVQVTIYYRVPLMIPLVNMWVPNQPCGAPHTGEVCFPLAARSAMRGE